ncbi:hypothetical protein ACFO0N_17685 [Halobium salinum]|uniref:DUF7344 domain-containing protein n=1 Tax=Halobium salinum TaxID=1364940 RepID=A0ABD5PFT8_9EURY|nr:hypothetical protein [Halobium salinum]
MSSEGVAEYSVSEEESDGVTTTQSDADAVTATRSEGERGEYERVNGEAVRPVTTSPTADGEQSTAGTDTSGGSDTLESVEREMSTPTPLSDDSVFEVLSNRRRRLLLHYLRRHDGTAVELSELSSQLAAWEQETTPEMISYADRKNVHTALYQFHLPKMEDAGFVDYDQRSGSVELTEAARDLEVSIGSTTDRKRVPERYLLPVSAVGLLLATASWLGVGAVTTLSGSAWAVLIAATFLAASVTVAYRTRSTDHSDSVDPL